MWKHHRQKEQQKQQRQQHQKQHDGNIGYQHCYHFHHQVDQTSHNDKENYIDISAHKHTAIQRHSYDIHTS